MMSQQIPDLSRLSKGDREIIALVNQDYKNVGQICKITKLKLYGLKFVHSSLSDRLSWGKFIDHHTCVF